MPLLQADKLLHRLRCGKRFLGDGAVGSELMKSGVDPARTVYASTERPELVRELHQKSIEAGAQMLTCNTFGMPDAGNWAESFKAGICLASDAARGAVSETVVAISVFPEELLAFGKPEWTAWDEAGGQEHLLLIETATHFGRAIEAFRTAAASGVEHIGVTCHFVADGRMPDGTSPSQAAVVLEQEGICLVGGNCGQPPEILLRAAEEMRRVTALPLLFQPSAGNPLVVSGQTQYPISPEKFAELCVQLVDSDVQLIGGCCGTTPAHIAVFRRLLSHTQRCI